MAFIRQRGERCPQVNRHTTMAQAASLRQNTLLALGQCRFSPHLEQVFVERVNAGADAGVKAYPRQGVHIKSIAH